MRSARKLAKDRSTTTIYIRVPLDLLSRLEKSQEVLAPYASRSMFILGLLDEALTSKGFSREQETES